MALFTKAPAPKLASLASTIVMACEAYRNCSANSDHPWGPRWASLLDAIEADLLPSGGGFDNGTKIDREATNAKRISLRIAFHHMDESGGYDGWTRHYVTINPTFRGCEVRVSGSNRNEIRDYISEVVSSLFSESNRIAYTFDDQGEVTLIPEQA